MLVDNETVLDTEIKMVGLETLVCNSLFMRLLVNHPSLSKSKI